MPKPVDFDSSKCRSRPWKNLNNSYTWRLGKLSIGVRSFIVTRRYSLPGGKESKGLRNRLASEAHQKIALWYHESIEQRACNISAREARRGISCIQCPETAEQQGIASRECYEIPRRDVYCNIMLSSTGTFNVKERACKHSLAGTPEIQQTIQIPY